MMRKMHVGAVVVVAGMWLVAGTAAAGGVKAAAGGKTQVAQLPIVGPLQAGVSTPFGKLGVAINKAPLLNQMTSTDLAGGFQQFMAQLKQSSATSPQTVLSTAQQQAAAPQQFAASTGQTGTGSDELETTGPDEQEVGGDSGQATVGAGTLANLTPEQQQQIQNLQGQLDSGAIDQNAFASQVQNVLGTAGSGYMVGGLGGAFDQAANTTAADPLNLTDAQLQQAQDIATRMHTDIAALREAAHALIVELLTPEQQAVLSAGAPSETGEAGEGAALPQNAPAQTTSSGVQTASGTGPTGTAQPGQNGLTKQLAPMRTPIGSAQTASASASAASSGIQTAGGSAASSDTTGVGSTESGALPAVQNPADQLQLTDAQKTQIDAIRGALRYAVQARHQQARDEFLAILTPEQQAILAQMEQSYGAGTAAAAAEAGGQ